MKCRECGDPAHYYVELSDRGKMPWFYCLSCMCWFAKLGHTATFKKLHGSHRPISQSSAG